MSLKKIIRGLTITSLFLLPIFPLIIANSFFFPFITGKAFFFRIVVEIAFAGWIILAFMDHKYRPRKTSLSIGVSIFTFVILVADLLGVNPLRSIWSNFERMEGWVTIVHLWALFIVMLNMFTANETSNDGGKRLWHRWLNFSLLISVIVAIYGFFQLFGWASIHQGSSRLDASLGNSAYMAIYMLIHTFVAGYMYFVARAKKIANHKMLIWVYPILAIVFSFLVFQTQTRGTILGLIGGIIIALGVYSLFGKGESKRSRLISGGIILGIVLLGIIFWQNRESNFVKNNQVLNRLATISISDVKTQARGYIWPMAIRGVMERPVLGWGQENFNYIFNANYVPAMYEQEQWFDRAHNVYLDWLVAGGFVGLLSYLALYVLLLVRVWKSNLNLAERSVLTGLVSGYAIHNVFVFDNLASYAMFFAFLAFVDSLGDKDKVKRYFGTREYSKDAVEYVVTPIVLVCLLVVIYFVQYRVVIANGRLIQSLQTCNSGSPLAVNAFKRALEVNSYTANQEIREQLLNCSFRVISSPQIPSQVKQEFFTLAMDEIDKQVEKTPKDARIYTLAGSFLNNIGQFPDAQVLLEKAYQLSPGKQTIAFELATSYLSLGTSTDKAIDILKKAYESEKKYSQAKLAYATALIASGKESLAKDLFSDDQSQLINPQIARAYLIDKKYNKAIEIYKALIKASPDNIENRVQLAQIQYTAGLKYDAISTLQSLANDRPELKTQIEESIKQIREQ